MTTAAVPVTLHEEHAAMATLLDVLRQEQQGLVSMTVEVVDQTSAQKATLVARMATLAEARHRALAAAGQAPTEAGMEAWLAQSGPDLLPLWTDLLRRTREAQELNRVNGVLINRHMAFTNGALAALRPAAQRSNVYGPTGLTMSGPAKRGFVVG